MMLSPIHLTVTGIQTSIAVAPAAATGAYGEKYLAMKGMLISVILSRMILANSAVVPSSAAMAVPTAGSLRVVIRTEERE